MSDRVRSPAPGVILLLVGLVILAAGVGAMVMRYDPSPDHSEVTPTQDVATPTDDLHSGVNRTVDREAGVVCYLFYGRSIDCLPLDETRLTPRGGGR